MKIFKPPRPVKTKPYRCQWCGEHPVFRDSFGRALATCGCKVCLTPHKTLYKAILSWNKTQKGCASRQDYHIQMPLEDIPKYLNDHVAYSRFIMQKRLAGEDYSVEEYNK